MFQRRNNKVHYQSNEGVDRRKMKDLFIKSDKKEDFSDSSSSAGSFWTFGLKNKTDETADNNNNTNNNPMGNTALCEEINNAVDESANGSLPQSSQTSAETNSKLGSRNNGTQESQEGKGDNHHQHRIPFRDRINIFARLKMSNNDGDPHWSVETTQNVKKWWDHIVSQILQDDCDGYQNPTQLHFRSTPRVLLHGCETLDQHFCKLDCLIDDAKKHHGLEGLQRLGLEFRFVPHPADDDDSGSDTESDESGQEEVQGSTRLFCRISQYARAMELEQSGGTLDRDAIMVTSSNRREFIADGEMFEQVARLCQEYAQDCMIDAGSLKWVTICENGEPIRVLIDSDHVCNSNTASNNEVPTLLITTGKGKVRAGIFSRRHLMTTGMEASTALPMVMEAKRRGMRVILVDPNARGERMGMTTYEKSLDHIFFQTNHMGATTTTNNNNNLSSEPSNNIESLNKEEEEKRKYKLGPLYILAHSASGAQLVRYLLDREELIHSIQSIAFTDSTHNIQWTKTKLDLHNFLQSNKALYFKTSSETVDFETKEVVGSEAETDQYWEHRFGTIKTVWAGTEEHSLSNFTAHSHIWQHFDTATG